MTMIANKKITVVVLSYNYGKKIIPLLTSITKQTFKGRVEILVIDSSTDEASREILRNLDFIRLVEISNAEFGHGRTRDKAMELARGEYVAFLTQDALPVNENWLRSLLRPFSLDQKIVCVFGRQIPFPDANPIVKSWVNKHFEVLSKSGDVVLHSDENLSTPGLYYNSNVNAMYDKSYFVGQSAKFSFGDVDYAEDHVIAKKIIDSGYKKVYTPHAAVYHSHSWKRNIEYFLRIFDETMNLKRYVGYEDPGVGLKNIHIKILKAWWQDLKAIWGPYSSGFFKNFYWSCRSLFINEYRLEALFLGKKYKEIPEDRRKLFSYETLQKLGLTKNLGSWLNVKIDCLILWTIYEFYFKLLRAKYDLFKIYLNNFGLILTIKFIMQGKFRDVSVKEQNYEFVKLFDSAKKPDLEKSIDSKVVSWIVPAFGKMSGGQTTIFRIAKVLEKMGYKQNFYIIPPYYFPEPDHVAKLVERNYFKFENVSFHYLSEENLHIEDSKYLIMTEWRTAYYGYPVANVAEKIYFVQDLETEFFPQGAVRSFVDNTYKMGYKFIAASRWLEKVLTEKYGMSGGSISLGVDPEEYGVVTEYSERKRAICFYTKEITDRRGTELGVEALKLVQKRMPDLAIYFFGDNSFKVPAEFSNAYKLGILSKVQLRKLYNDCKLGLAFSFTNYSLIPQEMNACGLPAVDIDWEGNQINYEGREGVVLVEPDVHKLAKKVVDLLQDDEKLQPLSVKAVEEVKGLDWQAQIEMFILVLTD